MADEHPYTCAPTIPTGVGGRPPYDRDFLTNDLLEWVQDSDHWTIKAWRIRYRIPRETVNDIRLTHKPFSDAYAYAMDVIAQRREEMNHNDEMKDSLYNQHVKVYDKDRAEYDESVKDKQLVRDLQKIEREIELKAAQGIATKEEVEYLEKSFGIVDQLQELLSARKMAVNNSKAEEKS
jgi:hypothetical protein